jgi:glycosyltransferase involved in cell wall biosynthesis
VSRPVRVLLVGPGPDSAGGVWAVLSTLLASDLTTRMRIRRVATHRDGSARDKLLAAAKGYLAVLRELVLHRPDVAWINTSANASFRRKSVVMALTALFRVPRVIHVHAGEFADYYRDAPAPERAAIRRGLGGAARCIALTQSWKGVLDGISGGDAVVIPNPVAVPERPGARERGVVVFLGRYGEQKGTPTLLQAFARVAAEHPEARLIAAGDGERERAVALAAELGIADRLDARGWLPHDEGQALLARAAVFVLPSREEGLPVALLEAMAHGVPVVASAVGGIPDMVQDGVHGRLIAPGDADSLADAIGALLADPEGAAAMGDAARGHIERSCSVPVVSAALEATLSDAARPRRA